MIYFRGRIRFSSVWPWFGCYSSQVLEETWFLKQLHAEVPKGRTTVAVRSIDMAWLSRSLAVTHGWQGNLPVWMSWSQMKAESPSVVKASKQYIQPPPQTFLGMEEFAGRTVSLRNIHCSLFSQEANCFAQSENLWQSPPKKPFWISQLQSFFSALINQSQNKMRFRRQWLQVWWLLCRWSELH